ncbi:GNAT family N-acetyltransferase [Glycomyces luteolus]|uniref:GNAT family N-acetyltransferase n=1 Tax=Glycomyces luteolus TaxID=2670330 RepID=A0A9X3PCM3_9ACTN|nr:GNAT family N-acetyltransferase [Glycomyces luteolus]MDA1360139.1 GNAT family N-acetyltransferase [Glycomyces luteolus]
MEPQVTVAELVPDRWPDFLALARQMGANRSCYCMWWREERGERLSRPRSAAAREVVDQGPPGLIAYADGEPVGWCAVAPRSAYPRLNTARGTRPLPEPGDLDAVWVVSCFFVPEQWRGRGVSRALLDAAVDFAYRGGAAVVEGVPIDPAVVDRSPGGSYTGTLPMFLAAGFEEVARPTPKARVTVRHRRRA